MNKRALFSVGGVVAACAVAAFVWFALSRGHGSIAILPSQAAELASASSTAENPQTPPLGTTTPQTAEVDANSRKYVNAAYHFSLIYPKNLAVEEDKEQGGALTVLFQDPQSGNGFDIYITPYDGSVVTKDRFLGDEPSGVYESPTNVLIDGTAATMFFGQNPIMGDTREVWFIRGGFLYEVATYKDLDSWLGGIMQGWKFI